MAKKAAWFVLATFGILMLAPVTFAQTSGGAASTTNWITVAAAIALGITAAACGIGQGIATASACEGIARNPGAGGAIRITFIIGVALIESLTLYALLIVLIK
ncbi:MAG: ATP synthase F0 subunit C [Candidatus Acidiferrales bacterium]